MLRMWAVMSGEDGDGKAQRMGLKMVWSLEIPDSPDTMGGLTWVSFAPDGATFGSRLILAATAAAGEVLLVEVSKAGGGVLAMYSIDAALSGARTSLSWCAWVGGAAESDGGLYIVASSAAKMVYLLHVGAGAGVGGAQDADGGAKRQRDMRIAALFPAQVVPSHSCLSSPVLCLCLNVCWRLALGIDLTIHDTGAIRERRRHRRARMSAVGRRVWRRGAAVNR